MKKRLTAVILTVLTLLASASISIQSARAASLVTVIVDGEKVNFPDAPAYVDENGRTQIPTRYIGEAMGAKVIWESAAKRATFMLDIEGVDRQVDFYIGSEAFYFKNAPDYYPERQTMDTAAIVE